MPTEQRPLGDLLTDPTPASRPSPATTSLKGRTVTLEPLRVSDAGDLFGHIGESRNPWLWDYMPFEPPADVEELRRILAMMIGSGGSVPWAVKVPEYAAASSSASASPKSLGFFCYLNINPTHRTIEIGNVLFSPTLQGTTPATEAIYLLARHAFRDLRYRRLEWKCNTLNAPSCKAALRLGFTYEGTFRQHFIVKGRNRDTAWFSMLDFEWDGIESAFQRWLHPSNFSFSTTISWTSTSEPCS